MIRTPSAGTGPPDSELASSSGSSSPPVGTARCATSAGRSSRRPEMRSRTRRRGGAAFLALFAAATPVGVALSGQGLTTRVADDGFSEEWPFEIGEASEYAVLFGP